MSKRDFGQSCVLAFHPEATMVRSNVVMKPLPSFPRRSMWSMLADHPTHDGRQATETQQDAQLHCASQWSNCSRYTMVLMIMFLTEATRSIPWRSCVHSSVQLASSQGQTPDSASRVWHFSSAPSAAGDNCCCRLHVHLSIPQELCSDALARVLSK